MAPLAVLEGWIGGVALLVLGGGLGQVDLYAPFAVPLGCQCASGFVHANATIPLHMQGRNTCCAAKAGMAFACVVDVQRLECARRRIQACRACKVDGKGRGTNLVNGNGGRVGGGTAGR